MNRILMMQNDSAHGNIHCLKETDGSVHIPGSCLDILNGMCLAHGSTVSGRRSACTARTGQRIKVPVLISEMTEEIYFPLLSPESADCIWILYNELAGFHAQSGGCRLVFFNGMPAFIPYDYRMVKKQCRRCGDYLKMLRQERDADECRMPEVLRQIAREKTYETVIFR